MMKKLGILLILMSCAVSIAAALPHQDAAQPALKASVAENHPGGNSGKKHRRQHQRRNRKRGQAMTLRNTEPKPVNHAPPPTERQPAHRNPWTERPLKPEQPEKPAEKPAKDNP
ncbi:MAG TPA: hypothetical protein VGO91_02945 [Pyrinomonadaceae bacterium]|jgi:hypothetical protein|nr:hypothetical protein [Pyrinomonadaceae bacterium]